MRFPVSLLICLTILCAAGSPAPGAQQNSAAVPTHALTNQDIVRMTKASFGDSTIVKMIETHGSSFASSKTPFALGHDPSPPFRQGADFPAFESVVSITTICARLTCSILYIQMY